MNKNLFYKKYTGILLLLPILTGVFVFFILPFGIVLAYSVGIRAGQNAFCGLENYKNVLQSQSFLLATGNTLKFLLLGVPLLLMFALSIALLLRHNIWGRNLCSNSILLPFVLPIASIATIVDFLIPSSMLESTSAFWILLALYLWKNCGYIVVLLLAGLSMIPETLYDTATMEGASSFQKLRFITLPLLKSSLAFSIIIGIVNNFKAYREAVLLGGQHPHESIYLLQHFLNNNFANLNYTRLSVASVIITLPIILVITFGFIKKEHCT